MTSEHRKEWEKLWRNSYYKENPGKRLLWGARKRAKEANLPCTIQESDINIPEYCPYLKIKLTTTSKRFDTRTTEYSLDKIITELGYVPGNVEVISHLANTMKSNASKEQLLEFAKTIIERYG